VTYDSNVRVLQPFISADRFDPPMLNSQGFTYTGTAILKALDLIEERKALYRANGIAYYRPWVLLITDGAPQANRITSSKRRPPFEGRRRKTSGSHFMRSEFRTPT